MCFCGPAPTVFGEMLQGEREDRRVYLRQDQPLHLPGPRTYEAVEVEPLVPALPSACGRSLHGAQTRRTFRISPRRASSCTQSSTRAPGHSR